MTPRRFRKLPVVIEAMHFISPQRDWSDLHQIAEWCGGELNVELLIIDIPTLEGVTRASYGDWVIRGVKGEFYACKPDIFAQTYEAA